MTGRWYAWNKTEDRVIKSGLKFPVLIVKDPPQRFLLSVLILKFTLVINLWEQLHKFGLVCFGL